MNVHDAAIATLIGEAPDARAVRKALGSEPDWAGLLAASRRHAVAIPVLMAIRAAGIAVPPSVDAEDRAIHAAAQVHHAAFLGSLRRALRALDPLRVVCLKGPVLAERLHALPYGRSSTDLDVLVAPEDRIAAVEALRPAGWRPGPTREVERYVATHHHVILDHPTEPMIELHFHAHRGFGTQIPAAPLLARSSVHPVAGMTCRILDPVDEFVFLATHAARHRFVRLGWQLDLRLLLARERPDLDQILIRAREFGVQRPVWLALRRLGHAAPRSVSVRLAARLQGDRVGPGWRESLLNGANEALLSRSSTATLRVARARLSAAVPRIFGD
jgi:hypothetical protein